MLYADADALSCDRRQAEGEEGDVYNSGDDKNIDRHVRDQIQVNTGDK
jgi:hypothetical protein